MQQTLELLTDCIRSTHWKDIIDLFLHIKQIGRKLIKAAPMQHTIANIVKRVLHIIRMEAKTGGIPLPAGDEYQVAPEKSEIGPIESLYEITKTTPRKPEEEKKEAQTGKEAIKMKLEQLKGGQKQEMLQQLEEIMTDLDNMRLNVIEQAKEFILPNDVILTYDNSVTLVEFFAVLYHQIVFTTER